MSILTPDHELLADLESIIDEVNADYLNYLKHNNDEDNIEYLAELLNERSTDLRIDLKWFVDMEPRLNPMEWVSAMAGRTISKDFIEVYLWNWNLDGAWGPETFKEIVLGMFKHEAIHFAQYDRINPTKFEQITSGHQKGQGLGEVGYMRSYLSDPHELMAYGHDLAADIKASNNPEKSLRSPEAFIEELPVYEQYRRFFEPNENQIKRLLSYAARYTYV